MEFEEQVVEFNTAKLAKEVGFNEKCTSAYNQDKYISDFGFYKEGYIIKIRKIKNSSIPYILEGLYPVRYDYTAPTQAFLQKWLRETHNIFIGIMLVKNSEYAYNIKFIGDECLNDRMKGDYGFDTYESALEEGLYKALEIIKNGENEK